MLQEQESSASKWVSHSKILIQSEKGLSYAFIFSIICNFLELRELFFLLSSLDMGFLRWFGEPGVVRDHVPLFPVVEAESFFDTFLFLLRGQLQKFHCIYIHSIAVFGCPGGGGERLESLHRSSALLGNLFSMIPLVLEVGGLGVLVINFIWDGVKGYVLLHQQDRDSSSKDTDQDIVVYDAGIGNILLESQDVTLEWRREFPIFLGHVVGGKSRDGIPSSILVLKCCLELFRKLLWFTPILFFWTHLFFSCDYSSLPCHRPANLTCLCNCFLPSASLDFYDSFLLTVYTSLWFHRIPPCSFCFVITLDFPESQVYKLWTCYVLP